MKVYKFGGASVKDAQAVTNMARLVANHAEPDTVIVVSAMAKTTNALEEVAAAWNKGDRSRSLAYWQQIRDFHFGVIRELFEDPGHAVYNDVEILFNQLRVSLEGQAPEDFGQLYDLVVHFGELVSTRIIAHNLQQQGLNAVWEDARELLLTDSSFRRARIRWEETESRVRKAYGGGLMVTQGFIGADENKQPTTLGREGSDYTASVLAYCLGAEEVVIWKDVPGVLNGDPKVFDKTVLLEEISFQEAIELAYYGASVIHPKTIQPLQRKGIPLRVRSFVEPEALGTAIRQGLLLKPLVPCFIRKTQQMLITLSTRDLAFILEDHLAHIYRIFHRYGVRVNTTQNSAVSSSFCINDDPLIREALIKELGESFTVEAEQDLMLFTVRHYNEEAKWRVKLDRTVLLEQITPENYQVVVRG